MEKELVNVPYYHGLLPREDVKQFLENAGDFLVRMTEPSEPGKREFVLSVLVQIDGSGRNTKTKIENLAEVKDESPGGTKKGASGSKVPKHYVINRTEDGKFHIRKEVFDSVTNLIDHYVKSKTSLNAKFEVHLTKPVARRHWQLSHDAIDLTQKLGEGAFGEVYKGVLTKTAGGKSEKVDVAIKLAKLDNMTKDQVKEFMREARTMRHFKHPHVVFLYGVAATQVPLMLVMELAKDGALDSYLEKHKELTYEKRVEMCAQAAWGMEYLHEKNCLHRDLAARNCLYGDDKVKISDFGLSRAGPSYQMDPRNRVPIRWLAPETMTTSKYSFKTDVWSFGILIWEIMNFGEEPYHGKNVREVLAFVRGGGRVGTENMQVDLSELVTEHILAVKPEERFSMCQIARELEKISEAAKPAAPSIISSGPTIRNTKLGNSDQQEKTVQSAVSVVSPDPVVSSAVIVGNTKSRRRGRRHNRHAA